MTIVNTWRKLKMNDWLFGLRDGIDKVITPYI